MKVKKLIIYGLAFGLALIIWIVINNSVSINSPLAVVMTVIFFGIFGLTVSAFLRFERIKEYRKNILLSLFIVLNFRFVKQSVKESNSFDYQSVNDKQRQALTRS